MRARSVVLVGARGHGASHLDNLRRLQQEGMVRLVGVCDPQPIDMGPDVAWHSDLSRLLEQVQPEVAVVATPIHTHADLAAAAVRAGAHVLLEKPPTATRASFEQLLATVEQAGVSCQVGFQDLGSHALPAIQKQLAAGAIGDVTGIGGAGRWVRTVDYFNRSRWSGRRRLEGRDVVDGALTNPFAHAVASALWLAGAAHADDIAAVQTELFHVNDIEADDTSSVRIVTADGLPIVVAGTLAAEVDHDPWVVVHGTHGRMRLVYKRHRVVREMGDDHRTFTYGSTDLLENLLTHVDNPGVALLSPLQRAGAFMEVLEAVRTADPPRRIVAAKTISDEGNRRKLLTGIDDVVERCAEELRTFSELGMPWAQASATPDRPTARSPLVLRGLKVGDAQVGSYRSGSRLDRTLAPRPFLHPLRTLGGTPVTDAEPGDHVWHLGVSIAVPDVDGVNFWGGRTCVRGQGYLWRSDHGTIEHDGWLREDPDGFREALSWRGPDRMTRLTETRSMGWQRLPDVSSAWMLHLTTTLTNPSPAPVKLGSPATNGKPGSGYGGIFWRFPTGCRPLDVRSADAVGEEAVHGQRTPWLACRGDAGTSEGIYTVILMAADKTTAGDPWFVRVTGYPGICTAFAFNEPLIVPEGGSVTRALAAVVADGHLEVRQFGDVARRAVEALQRSDP